MRLGGLPPDPVMALQMTPPPASVVSALEPEQEGSAKFNPPRAMVRPLPKVEVAFPSTASVPCTESVLPGVVVPMPIR